MSPASGAERAERDLVRLCHSGLDLPALRAGVLRSLRRLLPVDAAFFATADPHTLLFTSAYAEEPLAAATALFLDNEFGDDDVNKFTALATARTHVSSLDAATRGDRFTSGRYRDIMRPAGLGDELRAALTVGPDCWGYLCLHRTDHPLGFTPAEAALLARVGPHIAHGLRQSLLLDATPHPDRARPGVLLLAGDGSVVSTTPEADALLEQLDPAPRLPLPAVVYAVVAALNAGRATPSAHVRGASGRWLAVHASRLGGPGTGHPADHPAGPTSGRVAVVVEPCAARATVPIRLAAHGLSARESEVAGLVLRGASTRGIAASLHISPHTVQDHLKHVFDKLGVRSRRDLVGLLLGG
ncbi:LuxR C-terminal-related transcriptional regulator [Pseudonocardia kunmingensis]|uniref:DNA-binding CsgD family transcriptional regulator n=1 Tax=Pseudonocardia kunmingensis TaxID=630975 RepID=A0A543D4Q4_9PSEU|nr:LuxR C-terminal-related transcriptional regulator [Pseudonocardia kunmingensis]TQM04198.1 DNA-binding CsgD family transcriptional regulator [Pseudonocardia kunmingensis]